MIAKSAGTRSSYRRRRADAANMITDPSDPKQQVWAFDHEFGFTGEP
jgi:hypothetical protein